METQKIKIKTAVVILNWNGKEWLEKFLPTIVRYSAEATVFVADNASNDDSVEFVKSNFPTVKIIINILFCLNFLLCRSGLVIFRKSDWAQTSLKFVLEDILFQNII